MAGQSGNFQLNVMLPLVADNLLQAIAMLQRAAVSLADKAIAGLQVNREHLQSQLARNPVLATALNPRIGYERSAEIAREASRRGVPVIDVAAEMTDLPRDELEALLDPRALTCGGMPG
jgi:fumarate hydratase class II